MMPRYDSVLVAWIRDEPVPTQRAAKRAWMAMGGRMALEGGRAEKKLRRRSAARGEEGDSGQRWV